MRPKTQKTDFTFLPSGYGVYKVNYTSVKTGKTWSAKISDMELIDTTKNSQEPKKKDLETLKRTVKNYSQT